MHDDVKMFSLDQTQNFPLRKSLVALTCVLMCLQLLQLQHKIFSLAQGKTQSHLLSVVFKLECLFLPKGQFTSWNLNVHKKYFKDTFLKPTVSKSPERTCDCSGNSSVHILNLA